MATIRDVAALAGVSTTTVSRVLNMKDSSIPISDETRKRVIAAAQSLQYEPNYFAKGLARRRTDTVGLVMYDLAHLLHPNFSQIVHGVASALSETRFDLMLLPLKAKSRESNDQPWSIASYFKQGRVEGMILAAQEVTTHEIVALHQGRYKVVLIGGDVAEFGIPSVEPDVATGMQVLIDHLVSQGHRRVGFVNGPVGFRINDAMALGYRKALEHVHAFDPQLLVNVDFSSEQTISMTKELMTRDDPPTAIVAADDLMAVDVIKAVTELGRCIPHDLSVAGFADLPTASCVSHSLTTVRVPIAESGHKAAQLLLQLIDDKEPQQIHEMLPTELVIRDSTGPAPC